MNQVGAFNILMLIIVLFSVQHYTGHWCIAIGAIAALLFLMMTRD